MSADCPSSTEWDHFLTDRASAQDEARLTEHLQTCKHCQSLLEQRTSLGPLFQAHHLIAPSPGRDHFTNHLEAKVLPAVLAEVNSVEESPTALPTISGYELLDRIGEGGSSIVYRARDSRLQRIVAIKILRTAASPVQRQRFNKEAQALASLRHLNIAGIIEVGEADGRAYLVLEYISGGSLASYLYGRSQPPLECARLMHQLAAAVQKAHDCGIIHRDLKPGNVLLDPHFGASETSGLDRFIPKLIDYGIAKDLESPEEFTRTCDFLGTPSYMAPEQVTRTRTAIDQRTDVYALGIILYEMLTGRPPFRAASPIDTMLQIKHEDPIPPSRFEPKLPRDLENICLKCFEKDPTSRYQSAQLLADDLDRFLTNKPVLARPISQSARLWRWCRRNPGRTIAASFSALILLTLAIAGPLLAAHEHALREQAARSAQVADFERNRARNHLDLAGNALEELLDKLLFNTRLQDTVFEEMQKGLVGFTMPYLEQFVRQEDSSGNLRLRQARGLLQLAMVQTKTGDIDTAQITYESALNQLSNLQSSESLSQETRWRSLSSAHLEYGRFLTIHRKQESEGETHFRESLALLEKLSLGDTQEKYLDSFAILYSLIGSVSGAAPERQEETLSYIKKAVDLREKLVELHPARDDLRHYAAMARMNLAIYYRDNGPVGQEVEQFRQALDHELKVNHSKSVWIESPYYVTLLHGECGAALARAGKKEESINHLKSAVKTAEALTTVYPAVEKYTALHKRAQVMLRHYDK